MSFVMVSSALNLSRRPWEIFVAGGIETYVYFKKEGNQLGNQLTTRLYSAYYPHFDDHLHPERPHKVHCCECPPYEVLSVLESLGYKVVGTHTIDQTCMWTLHKQT